MFICEDYSKVYKKTSLLLGAVRVTIISSRLIHINSTDTFA